MMKKLQVSEGDYVLLKSVHLEKGKYVKLKPHTSKWLEVQENSRKSM